MMHGGEQKSFGISYLFGTPLINNVSMPNGMVLSKNYEENRDLLTEMLYKRNTVEVAKRSYTYDNLARPVTRVTQREGSSAVTDSFAYNGRSELSAAMGLDYTYDNIGNRRLILSGGVSNMYTTNRLNQYTVIHSAEHGMLTPEYDRAGNQTKLRSSSTWNVTYDANNRPVQFTSGNGSTVIDCAYDYMGRRISKKVTRYDNVVEHRRFIYRGFLQIGAYDVNTGDFDYFLLWDPTEPVATRPLAIRKGADWYAYGIDLTKNVCELFDAAGAIATRYDYTPYGQVTATGNVTQPIQWSSEYADTDLGLVYYNYRHYNPTDGRWISRDPIAEQGSLNLYGFVGNGGMLKADVLGRAIFILTALDAEDSLIREKIYDIPEKGIKRIDELVNKIKEIGKNTFLKIQSKKSSV